MANWDVETKATDYDLDGTINGLIQGRNRTEDFWKLSDSEKDKYKMADGTTPASEYDYDIYTWEKALETAGINLGNDYDMVGMVGAEVPKMRQTIKDYVEGVQTTLSTAITNIESSLKLGFKGTDAETAVKEYLEKVKSYVTNLVSSLNAFSNQIAAVGNAWIDSQTAYGTKVNTEANAFSTGTAVTGDEIVYNAASTNSSSSVGASAVEAASATTK